MKIVSVVGARPQFIKASTVSDILRKNFDEIMVHTGQHYDENMSKVFFQELGIPFPDYNLGVGSCSHAAQTARIMEGIEKIFIKEKPDMVLVYGDTNSTLAAALCASKMLIPVAHVEAGLRSFNMKMPEEQNRILTDHISSLLFTPTETAVKNLKNEGLCKNVYNVGDVMYDGILKFKGIAEVKSRILEKIGVKPDEYILATIHRAENTDNPEVLREIFEAFNTCGAAIVFPVHPRTGKYISDYNIKFNKNVILTEPIGYLDMIKLEANAKKIVTDSGGVQKEAFFISKPCITVRNETEWVETVDNGWNILVGTDRHKILNAINSFYPSTSQKNVFGDGKAAEKIVRYITDAVSHNLIV